jgi:hypothetical protein
MPTPESTADRYLHGAYHPNGHCPNGMCAEPTARELRSAVDDGRMTDPRCPSVSPYWDLQCDLPDERDAHPKGHEHKRRMSATRFDTETVVWGTSDADAERWGDG